MRYYKSIVFYLAFLTSVLCCAGAGGETVTELFAYRAPSGMFGEGTFKWQLYRFFFEDRERMANFRAGRGFAISEPSHAVPNRPANR